MKTYLVTGKKYSDKQSYYNWDVDHNFANFDTIDTISLEIVAESLEDAELALLESYPDYWMGCCIIDQEKKSNFSINAEKATTMQ